MECLLDPGPAVEGKGREVRIASVSNVILAEMYGWVYKAPPGILSLVA